MARSTTLALIAAAAALAWNVGADAQQQQRQRQPRPAAPPKATAAPKPSPKPAPPAPVPVVNVQTNPSGAACQIVGPGGQAVSRVFGTPESVPLPNRSGNEQLVCNKPGFREMRGALAPAGQSTTVALAVDPNSKIVTRESVDPGIPLQAVTFEQLMELQRLQRAGKIPDRLYYANRRYFIAHDASLPPMSAPSTAARPMRTAG